MQSFGNLAAGGLSIALLYHVLLEVFLEMEIQRTSMPTRFRFSVTHQNVVDALKSTCEEKTKSVRGLFVMVGRNLNIPSFTNSGDLT
ncbi:hypothetical protein TSMEX_005096 [Taenia solium]|eukprot:TsM_000426700 transcript=TsM_000426700 gene=TsM_000426700